MKNIVKVAKTIADEQNLQKFDSFKALKQANDIVDFQLKLIEVFVFNFIIFLCSFDYEK